MLPQICLLMSSRHVESPSSSLREAYSLDPSRQASRKGASNPVSTQPLGPPAHQLMAGAPQMFTVYTPPPLERKMTIPLESGGVSTNTPIFPGGVSYTTRLPLSPSYCIFEASIARVHVHFMLSSRKHTLNSQRHGDSTGHGCVS